MTVTSGLTCAPCVTDLALVREAVTSVAGTSCCQAHAVLLTYPHDAPGRRRARVEQLRDLAEAKMELASESEKASLELLVSEYALIAVMDMGGNRDAQPGQQRRDGQRDGNREPRAPRTGAPREPREGQTDAARAEGEGRGRRGRRGRPERPAAEGIEQTTHVTVTSGPSSEPTPAAADAPATSPAPTSPAPTSPAPTSPTPTSPVVTNPAPTNTVTVVPAPAAEAPAPAAPVTPAAPATPVLAPSEN